MNGKYLELRPYREKLLQNENGVVLLKLMQQGFARGFKGYWEQFGYEIGGPVCYAYTKWLSDDIDRNHPEITDIAFVARDGWLLKKIYDLLPGHVSVSSHYVYAPRSLALLWHEAGMKKEYQRYLDSVDFGEGVVAVVDTVTMKFSSQQLLDNALENKTFGYYWVVLDREGRFQKDFRFSTYQQKRYHTIRVWNLMEFIMSSPEPPIQSMADEKPIYREANSDECKREELFLELEEGVLSFVRDFLAEGKQTELNNRCITEWVNDFLKNPDDSDKRAFEGIMFSERADHADSVPLDPFGQNKIPHTPRALKERIWLFSQKRKILYIVLHKVNHAIRNTEQFLRGFGYVRYNGECPWILADRLAKYDVVSFDIFDTLIHRRVKEPTDLFYELEKQSGLCDFHEKRILAEWNARQTRGTNGEINIFDIYDELVLYYGQGSKELALQEIEAERMTCYADQALATLYQILMEKNVRMIATSDMYLPSQYLREILEGCGYGGIEQVFVSCEYGAGKADGALQRMVQSELGEELRYVHIGDNQFSDVHGSRKAGWDAVWYRRKTRNSR